MSRKKKERRRGGVASDSLLHFDENNEDGPRYRRRVRRHLVDTLEHIYITIVSRATKPEVDAAFAQLEPIRGLLAVFKFEFATDQRRVTASCEAFSPSCSRPRSGMTTHAPRPSGITRGQQRRVPPPEFSVC